MRQAFIATALTLTLSLPSTAQFQNAPAPFYNAWAASSGAMMNNNIINAPLAFQARNAAKEAARRGPAASRVVVTSYDTGSSAAHAEPHAFVARLQHSDPAAAAQIASAMRGHDFGQIYSGIVAPFGLRRGDAADALTAYMVLGWMIANGGADPGRGAVAVARAEIAAKAATNPAFATQAGRAQLGEEMAIMFVILHAGWQSARKNGTLPQFSEQVAAMFKTKFGTDLHALALTDHGFEARG